METQYTQPDTQCNTRKLIHEPIYLQPDTGSLIVATRHITPDTFNCIFPTWYLQYTTIQNCLNLIKKKHSITIVIRLIVQELIRSLVSSTFLRTKLWNLFIFISKEFDLKSVQSICPSASNHNNFLPLDNFLNLKIYFLAKFMPTLARFNSVFIFSIHPPCYLTW